MGRTLQVLALVLLILFGSRDFIEGSITLYVHLDREGFYEAHDLWG